MSGNAFSAEDEAKGLNMIRLCSEALVQAVAKCMVDAQTTRQEAY